MTLNNTLSKNKGKESKMVTFYHVSTETTSFKSFFREGAKTIGKGIGGQKDGFFVWTNEKAANEHIHFVYEDPFSDKILARNEALIIGVNVPKNTITYPLWQQDYEKSVGIFKLWIKYGNFLNTFAVHLDIPFNIDDKPLGWNFNKITGFEFKKSHSKISQKDFYQIIFKGIDERGIEQQKIIGRNEDNLDEGADGAYDSIKFQLLTDWLCQNNPHFKKDYDTLMQKMITENKGYGFKYTGTTPLSISLAQYVKIKADGSLKKVPIFDVRNKANQICPFLTMKLIKEGNVP